MTTKITSKELQLLKKCSWRLVHTHKDFVTKTGDKPPHGKLSAGVARELCAKHLFGAPDVNHFTASPSDFEFWLYREGLTLQDFSDKHHEFMEDIVVTLSSQYLCVNPAVACIYMANATLWWREPLTINSSEDISATAKTAQELLKAEFKQRLLPAVTGRIA